MVQKSAGRPLGFEPDEALAGAVGAFWEQGYDGTSLPELERATGLARSSLYNSFGTKRELFITALTAYAKSIGDALTEPLQRGDTGIGDIRSFLDLIERHVRDRSAPDGCLIVNSLVETGDSDPAVARIVDGYLERLRGGFAAALRRAAALGEVDGDDVAMRADLLLTLVVGISAVCRAGDGSGLRLLNATCAQVEAWRR